MVKPTNQNSIMLLQVLITGKTMAAEKIMPIAKNFR